MKLLGLISLSSSITYNYVYYNTFSIFHKLEKRRSN